MNLKFKRFFGGIVMLAVWFSSATFTFARRDEGMYTPDQIVRLPLAARGLKIKPTEIYNPNGGGLTDAVVRLSIGCTAEFVSPEGLILTNHHCGFDALVSASTPGTDYVENGFKADSRATELPAQYYSLFVTQRVEDVSAKIRRGTENLTGEPLAAALKKNTEDLQTAEQGKAPKGSTIRIQSLNSGFYFYLYQTMQVKDVRVVYAPPRNIGVFGGDPDNFEWTRHTGDFTFLRAYTAPDGSSAEYSPSNIPLKTKKFLTINIGGLKENDFVFVLGYPGTTTRYRESQSIEYAQNTNFPYLAAYLQARSDALRAAGETDEAKRIKFQSEIANFDNYRKVYGGGSIALKRADEINKRRAEEQQFAQWVNANPQRQQKYGEVLANLKTLSDLNAPTAASDVILQRFPSATVTPVFKQVYDAVVAVQQGKKLSDNERAKKLIELQEIYKTREPIAEREMIKFNLRMLADLPANQKLAVAEKLFGGFEGKERRSAEETFAESVAEKTNFDAPEKVLALYDSSFADLQKKYPNIVEFIQSLAQERNALTARTAKYNGDIDRVRLLYQQGMAEMKNIRPYPDANSTLRFTFGNIRGYSPREAIQYSPFTTLKGVIEKDTGINPFDVPQKLKDLQNAQDFGRFGANGTVPVNFISTTDIIGGNSGSPVLNAYGEQVGLVFDGNYEGLGNDIFYDPNYNRTISVDIRYVLFVTEKFGGAGWILNEMNIKGRPAAKTKRAAAK